LVKDHHAHLELITVLGVGWIAVSIFLANAIYLALTNLSVLGDLEREWLARSSGWFVAMTVVWAGFSALVLYADLLFSLLGGELAKAVTPLVGGGIGAAAALFGKSATTLASLSGKNGSRLQMSTVLAAGSMIFLVTLVAVFAHLVTPVRHLLDHHVLHW